MWSRVFSLSIRQSGQSGGISALRLSSSVAAQEQYGVDDFLNTLSSSSLQASNSKLSSMESSQQYLKWLSKNKVLTVDQYLNAAELATKVRENDQKKVFQKMTEITNDIVPDLVQKMQPSDSINFLRFLLQFDPSNSLVKSLQNALISNKIDVKGLMDVQFDTLLKIVRFSENAELDPGLVSIIHETISNRIANELNSAADMFTLLKHGDSAGWYQNEKFIKKVEQLMPIMGISEKCTLLKYMAADRQRNKLLLGILSVSISEYNQCLTVSQIVGIISSCSILSFYPARLSKKIAKDLQKNSNVLHKWADILIMADSFVRMKMGCEKSWEVLVRWAVQNEKDASPDQISRFVSCMAKMGISGGKVLANKMKTRIEKSRARSPTAWLNIVYSLAYFQELDSSFADSVLNKSFYKELLNSSLEKHDRLRKAMMLLTINECAKIDLKNEYNGPTVGKESFQKFGIGFDSESIRQSRQLKYAKNTKECDEIFLKSLFKIAPQDSHCTHSDIEESGIFVDAYVMPSKDSGLLIKTCEWGDMKPRPILFYGWGQVKQNVESPSKEAHLKGSDQLALRLLRANGYAPITVFKSDFDYCATDIDKVNMLREKIQS